MGERLSWRIERSAIQCARRSARPLDNQHQQLEALLEHAEQYPGRA